MPTFIDRNRWTYSGRHVYNPLSLMSVAHCCDAVISDAVKDLGRDSVKGRELDLCADQLDYVPLETLKTALVVAGYPARWDVK